MLRQHLHEKVTAHWVQETEAVMKQRFGGPGLRVFRLLLLHRQLEQKQVAEKAMLPPKVLPSPFIVAWV